MAPTRPQSRRTPFRRPTLGLDLSGTGAPRSWAAGGDDDDSAFIMGRLAGLAGLADRGGVDLLTLDATFRVGGVRRRDAWLDGALAASRLGRHTGAAVVAVSVPLGVTGTGHVASAVGSVHKATDGRAAWQVEGASRPLAARGVDAVVAELDTPRQHRRTGAVSGATTPGVVVTVREPLDLEIAAARADVARLRVGSLEEARVARESIRQAAGDWGRDPDDVRVLVDLHAVLGVDREGARARADLLAVLDPDDAPVASYPLSVVGTATDLVDLWQEWVEAGAADGFTVVPASVPTDVLAVVTEVVPLLERRGLRAAPAAARKVATAPAAAPVRAARSARRTPAHA